MTGSTFEPGLAAPQTPATDALLFLARGLELVVEAGEGTHRLPSLAERREWADGLHFLGRLGGRECYAAPLREEGLGAGMQLVPARSLFDVVDTDTFQVAGRALAIAEWDRSHRFCGKCATPTELTPNERSRKCPSCRTPFYPRIAPAVIVLIHREDTVLLARGANFPKPWFSTLAGFVEPGESLEETVAREVREEVGVELGAIRYFGSQPWPFGRSLMIGFNADYAGGELRLDEREIAEARFFRRDELPKLPPKLSIARSLVDAWAERRS